MIRIYSLLYLITTLHLIPSFITADLPIEALKLHITWLPPRCPLRNETVSFCHAVLNVASRPALKNHKLRLVSTSITMYISSLLQICFLALASLLPRVTAHNIQLGAHSRECFHEQLHKDDKMTVTFQVGDREFGGAVNFEIYLWERLCNYRMKGGGCLNLPSFLPFSPATAQR